MISAKVVGKKESIEACCLQPLPIEASKVYVIESGGSGGEIASYEKRIINAELTNSAIALPHNLNISSFAADVIIRNNLGQEVQASDVVFVDNNNLIVSLEGYTPIIGSWYIRIQ